LAARFKDRVVRLKIVLITNTKLNEKSWLNSDFFI